MTNEAVILSALALLGESGTAESKTTADETTVTASGATATAEKSTAGIDDYILRSTYLLPLVCRSCERVENAYRLSQNLPTIVLPDSPSYALTDTFPLSPPLLPAVSFGLASLLCLDENPTLSASLNARHTSALTALPAKVEKIR